MLEFFDTATGKLDFRKTTRHNIYDIEFHPQGNQLAMISGKEQTNERVLTVFDTQDTFGVPKADKPSKRKKKTALNQRQNLNPNLKPNQSNIKLERGPVPRVHLQLRLLSSARPQRLSRFENQMEKF